MADTIAPGARPADFHEFTALDEAAADLADACDAMQALVALLQGCDPEHPVYAGHLLGLLLPIATNIRQARDTLAVAG